MPCIAKYKVSPRPNEETGLSDAEKTRSREVGPAWGLGHISHTVGRRGSFLCRVMP